MFPRDFCVSQCCLYDLQSPQCLFSCVFPVYPSLHLVFKFLCIHTFDSCVLQHAFGSLILVYSSLQPALFTPISTYHHLSLCMFQPASHHQHLSLFPHLCLCVFLCTPTSLDCVIYCLVIHSSQGCKGLNNFLCASIVFFVFLFSTRVIP